MVSFGGELWFLLLCLAIESHCCFQSSLKNSRSQILKLHAKISALQKFIQELQGSLHTDLSNLKAFVKEEFWERMAEVSQVIETINKTVAELQKQTAVEKVSNLLLYITLRIAFTI